MRSNKGQIFFVGPHVAEPSEVHESSVLSILRRQNTLCNSLKILGPRDVDEPPSLTIRYLKCRYAVNHVSPQLDVSRSFIAPIANFPIKKPDATYTPLIRRCNGTCLNGRALV